MRQRVGVEGVGLDDVGAGLEVGAVDVLDELGLGQDQHLGAVLERLGVAAEARAAVVLLGRVAGVDQRAHRAVEDEDALRSSSSSRVSGVLSSWHRASSLAGVAGSDSWPLAVKTHREVTAYSVSVVDDAGVEGFNEKRPAAGSFPRPALVHGSSHPCSGQPPGPSRPSVDCSGETEDFSYRPRRFQIAAGRLRDPQHPCRVSQAILGPGGRCR